MSHKNATIPAHNSLEGSQNALKNALKVHEPPHGCELRNADEEAYWLDLMKSRAHDSWAPSELHMAYRILRQEFMIRQGRAELERIMAEGANPFHPDSIASEMNVQIQKAERLQLTNLRAIGLTSPPSMSKTLTDATKKERQAAEALGIIGNNGKLPSLLARN